ncbi:barstar family protein [Tenggerimyces flavus]|uniref:Barstar family protein n=1 Tax=Tenggerimyces flavus TaxID=1708749 RepID=A0ABV7Y3J6_9ACTN|nr:barstar family protein [Tenggerimyces flavus]MBM7788620.1 RNAse (barnase) inhibitor barstar [Tenggerimyces flavus]
MKGLVSLLTGEHSSGVYDWPSALSIDDVAVACSDAGWRFVLLDTSGVEDKSGLLDAVATAFELPAYFGRNFDALADSLSDVSGGRGVLVLWDGFERLASEAPKTYGTALDIFRERATQEGFGAFVLLLRRDADDGELPHFGR